MLLTERISETHEHNFGAKCRDIYVTACGTYSYHCDSKGLQINKVWLFLFEFKDFTNHACLFSCHPWRRCHNVRHLHGSAPGQSYTFLYNVGTYPSHYTQSHPLVFSSQCCAVVPRYPDPRVLREILGQVQPSLSPRWSGHGQNHRGEFRQSVFWDRLVA